MNDVTSSPGWLALVRGICEEPQSDLRRLVAADYLDERGDQAGASRGEFIRLQIDLSRRFAPTARGSQDYELAARRAASLLRSDPEFNGSGGLVEVTRSGPNLWCQPAGPMKDKTVASMFSRGFVSVVALTQDAFVLHAAAIFATHPVTRVMLTGASPVSVVRAGRHQADRYYFDRVDLPPAGRLDPLSAWVRQSHGRVDRRIPRRTQAGGVAARQGCTYYSLPESFAALSWDCVCQGRELAGLPPLKRSAVPS